MSLVEQIDQDVIAALKSGEDIKKETLRFLRSSLKNLQIDSHKESLSDEEVISVIQREIKRRKESVEAYTKASKPELAEQEKQEIEILSAYMPSQLSEQEIEAEVEQYLADNPTTVQGMGKAMGELSAKLKGKADLSVVSRLLRQKVA